ncbi:hypothetical protein A4S06_08635 [Erysipelotrichaceae bacterium MTC7]|nr:hypothetical protein A4S06_08635 [Erysipelotrichaceae bacterium MTC7]
MEKVIQQLLRDPNVEPTDELIADGLGEANNAYKKFINDLKEQSVFLMDWRFYNDGKAWLSKGEYKWITKRGTNKVKPIFWLSIWEGLFKVSFLFAEKTRDELIQLPLSEDTKSLIENTKPNGKSMQYLSVIFDVKNDSVLNDIYTLVKFRKEKI